MADPATVQPAATPASTPAADPAAAATAAAATAQASAGTRTVLNADPAGDKPVATPANWPDDWRDRLAGEDAKFRKRLDRFADPGALAKSYTQLETKLSSGQMKPAAPGKDATAEDVAAWRKDAGIPETPEGYLEHLDKGLVIGEDDKAAIGEFLKDMHAANADPAAVKQAVGWYYKNFESIQAEQAQKDDAVRQESEEALRAEWGADYRRNVNIINAHLGTAPEGVKDAFLNARDANGVPLASNPKLLSWMLGQALAENPAATVVPGGSGVAGASIDGRIAEIEKVVGTKAYWKDPKMQDEYRQLLEARERLSSKGRAA
jgi:hypothetical protein